jgi:hypothetical protein
VAHACNPSYSRGRDQEDCGSKPAWAKSSSNPISKKNPSQERAGGVAQSVGPEFKPQYYKKKNQTKIQVSSKALNIHLLKETNLLNDKGELENTLNLSLKHL